MTSISFATDEDVALAASSDFCLICPRDQKLACGTDGYFDPTDRWTLQSPSADFAALGVTPGMVVQLTGPTSAFRPPGELLVISKVAPGSATLRRKGQLAGLGQPPSPVSGLVGVEFLITSLVPQIARASDELGCQLGLGSCASMTGPALSSGELRELRDLTVLTVIVRQYLDVCRDPGGKPDALAAKAEAVRAELDEKMARATVRRGGGTAGEALRFSSRISR